MNTIQYIRDYYGVPAKIGGKVRMDGMPATITGSSCCLIIRPDRAEDRPHKSTRWHCHPTWHVEYLDRDGNVIWPAAKEASA